MAHQNPAIQKLLEDRYYLRNSKGELLETEPSQMFGRVAKAVAKAELNYTDNPMMVDRYRVQFYELMNNNKFLPNTPLLINAGKENPGCYSACFTVPVEDSMEGIFEAVKQAAIISKAGGGVGFNFSNIRAKGSIVKSTGHAASGPVSFMRVFNTMCDTVSQGGVRRGAMIAGLSASHPDILEFISCKDDGTSFTNFNISIFITNDFMQAVQMDGPWQLLSTDNNVVKEIKARELWDEICTHAWKTGEPGLVFIDRMRENDPEIQGVNPCGEIPLRDYESCNLASINLMAYVREHENIEKDSSLTLLHWFDLDALKKDIPTMVRFLDDVIDVNNFPLPEIEEATKKTRKIGLGIMGWADLLIALRIPYASHEALMLAKEIIIALQDAAILASKNLAAERGLPEENHHDQRNYTLLCVAPTGTISRIAQCSSGIEPVFAWKTHHKLVDLEYDEEHWAYKEFRDNVANDGLMLPDYMKTAQEISGEGHLSHQAVFQEYIDNSVSKTVNLPQTATVVAVDALYKSAWTSDCKGITVYRDGSRTDQPLNDTTLEKQELEDSSRQLTPEASVDESVAQFRERGQVAVGLTYKLDTTKGKMYITVNYGQDQTEPVEVFVRLGASATAREHELAEWCGRLLSTCLKYNVPIEKLVRQGSKVFSDISFIYNHRFFNSIPQLIGYLLEVPFAEAVGFAGLELSDGPIAWEPEFQLDPPTEQVYEGEYCYNCGQSAMIMSGGCKVCTNCGYEKCG